MRRMGLGSDSDISTFDARARLYGDRIKSAPSALDEIPRPKPPVLPPEKEEAEEIVLPKISTDAKIPGETAKPIPEYRIVGEVFASYVIIEVEEKMILIDKHAAHERINFERLRANMTSDTPNVQMLLAPDTVSITGEEAEICREYRSELEKVGFEFEISEREVRLMGIPEEHSLTEARELFMTLVTETMETGEPISLGKRGIFEKALYQSACKSAVKAGRVYDMAHIRWICDNLLRYDCIKFCPHGRPVAFELSKKELDSRFGRT
jgi:DNA mismatch repair protein MutL